MLIAAYCKEHTNISMDALASYLQTRQQRSRAAGPRESDRQKIAGMLSGALPADDDRQARRWYSSGQSYAKGTLMVQADPRCSPRRG